MEKRFKLKEHGTTVRTEIMAGITTFMAMAYILMVNAGMFADLGTVSYGAVYIATAISAVIGTVLIGLLSNLPLAQASGMGLNAYFVYTVCFGMGLSYANALVMVLVDGIVFVSGLHADTQASHERYERLRSRGIPIVLVNGFAGGIDAPFVSTDDVASVELSVRHLASLGHRSVDSKTIDDDT